MEEQAKKWLEINIEDSSSVKEKYQNRITQSENIKNKLKKYRLDKSKLMNVPAYYIFNDNELEKIINIKPKNIDEIKEILSPIKVKCHGEEILKIINQEQ